MKRCEIMKAKLCYVEKNFIFLTLLNFRDIEESPRGADKTTFIIVYDGDVEIGPEKFNSKPLDANKGMVPWLIGKNSFLMAGASYQAVLRFLDDNNVTTYLKKP